MSALPPIADIGTQSRNVRFVPKADIVERTPLPAGPEAAIYLKAKLTSQLGLCERSSVVSRCHRALPGRANKRAARSRSYHSALATSWLPYPCPATHGKDS